jgi:hypothetical protein
MHAWVYMVGQELMHSLVNACCPGVHAIEVHPPSRCRLVLVWVYDSLAEVIFRVPGIHLWRPYFECAVLATNHVAVDLVQAGLLLKHAWPLITAGKATIPE